MENIIIVASNLYIIRNWLVSDLAGMCINELNLKPLFATPYKNEYLKVSNEERYENIYITHDDIDNSLKLFLIYNVDPLISINKVHNHPSKMYRLINGQLEQYFDEPESRLRQE